MILLQLQFVVEWKLQEELRETKLTERLNRELLKRVTRAREIGKIDTRWNDKFMQKWYVCVTLSSLFTDEQRGLSQVRALIKVGPVA